MPGIGLSIVVAAVVAAVPRDTESEDFVAHVAVAVWKRSCCHVRAVY